MRCWHVQTDEEWPNKNGHKIEFFMSTLCQKGLILENHPGEAKRKAEKAKAKRC